MTSKVGIVLLLPVILASVFAGLRVKTELTTIGQLNTAGDQARIIRPMLEYTAAANQLAVASAAGADGGAQPTLDQDAAHFDQTLADLQAALQISKADKRVTTAVTNALSAGRTLRENRRGTSPMQIGKQADEIATHIDTAITALPTPTETAIERYYVQMGVIAIARQMFTQEQLWIISGELSNNPALMSQALLAAGGESATIHQYSAVYPESADRPDVLLAALQTRVDALGQNAVEPADVPGVTESLRTSDEIYTESTNRLVDRIDTSLSERLIEARGQVLRDVAFVVITLLLGLALALAVARSLVVPVRRLRRDALQVAHMDLPAELAVVRKGGATPEIVPVDVQTTEEIGQLARAVDDMHRQALYLAADQARLRLQISSMFETLSRRSQSLVEQQLTLIEDLERDEDDSNRLQSLFRLDHLATRMRRNGDNLLVLAGTALRRGHLPPVPLSDMLWSAVSQVEDYQRVEIGSVPDGVVAGEPAVDIEHLLAELIDNSLRYSPPSTPVAVSVTGAMDGGYLIEITDRGLGMSADDLRSINERLASGGEVTIETARRMGLFVVGRLAKRHTVTVSLRRTTGMSHQSGITAGVHLPGPLVSPAPGAADGPQPITGNFAAAGPPDAFGDPTTDPQRRLLSAVPDQQEPNPFGSVPDLPQRRPAEPTVPTARGPVAEAPADDLFADAAPEASGERTTYLRPPSAPADLRSPSAPADLRSPSAPAEPAFGRWAEPDSRTTADRSEEQAYLGGRAPADDRDEPGEQAYPDDESAPGGHGFLREGTLFGGRAQADAEVDADGHRQAFPGSRGFLGNRDRVGGPSSTTDEPGSEDQGYADDRTGPNADSYSDSASRPGGRGFLDNRTLFSGQPYADDDTDPDGGTDGDGRTYPDNDVPLGGRRFLGDRPPFAGRRYFEGDTDSDDGTDGDGRAYPDNDIPSGSRGFFEDRAQFTGRPYPGGDTDPDDGTDGDGRTYRGNDVPSGNRGFFEDRARFGERTHPGDQTDSDGQGYPDDRDALGNRALPDEALPDRDNLAAADDRAYSDDRAHTDDGYVAPAARMSALAAQQTTFLPRRTDTDRPDTALTRPADADSPPAGSEPATPIYQRMVSEWLVEPSSSGPVEMWDSPADEGWAAAADASRPPTADRTDGGLPIRKPGAQLVPGGLTPADEPGTPDPEEIRSNLSRHLSGVRSGRADAQYHDDGGPS
ncbi:ATP-binding protein [Nocardia sp. BMG51109]|uniref:ATP-binding protein n=1 Tax=Nocardia sp. BMG51109 TaxID=1056816 RepID=UPI0035109CD1